MYTYYIKYAWLGYVLFTFFLSLKPKLGFQLKPELITTLRWLKILRNYCFSEIMAVTDQALLYLCSVVAATRFRKVRSKVAFSTIVRVLLRIKAMQFCLHMLSSSNDTNFNYKNSNQQLTCKGFNNKYK